MNSTKVTHQKGVTLEQKSIKHPANYIHRIILCSSEQSIKLSNSFHCKPYGRKLASLFDQTFVKYDN